MDPGSKTVHMVAVLASATVRRDIKVRATNAADAMEQVRAMLNEGTVASDPSLWFIDSIVEVHEDLTEVTNIEGATE